MQRHFDLEQVRLREQLLSMGSHAAGSVNDALRALLERDEDLARKVEEGDVVLDRFEVEIDELAIHLLSRAPLATDLRLITVAMKISQNLERVGDEATTIARRARALMVDPPLRSYEDLAQAARRALEMLKEALDSFINEETEAARLIIPRDKDINLFHKRLEKELMEKMKAESNTVTRCMHLIVISKSIERIGDHAKNIAEEVVYLYEALDIRHTEASRSA